LGRKGFSKATKGIGPLRPPPTFAVCPPGAVAWVLSHPRNQVSHSMMDGISAYAVELFALPKQGYTQRVVKI
jgi:hypothetical protein